MRSTNGDTAAPTRTRQSAAAVPDSSYQINTFVREQRSIHERNLDRLEKYLTEAVRENHGIRV